MSHVEILAVRAGGDIQSFGRVKNSYGGAWQIWTELSQAYPYPFNSRSDIGFKPLWDAIQKLNERDQWVLAATFDRMIVPNVVIPHRPDLAALPTLIRHLDAFARQYPHQTLWSIIATLERARADRTVRGVCFNHSSAARDLWWVHGDNDDGGRVYNILLDKEHLLLSERVLPLLNDGSEQTIDTSEDDQLIAGGS